MTEGQKNTKGAKGVNLQQNERKKGQKKEDPKES